MCSSSIVRSFFFFNDTATTEIYTLSLHDALPIFVAHPTPAISFVGDSVCAEQPIPIDRKSTRLNSSHSSISYAVFCLKKNNITLARLLDETASLLEIDGADSFCAL